MSRVLRHKAALKKAIRGDEERLHDALRQLKTAVGHELNVGAHAARHPYTALSLAAALGFMLGSWTRP